MLAEAIYVKLCILYSVLQCIYIIIICVLTNHTYVCVHEREKKRWGRKERATEIK